MTNKQLMLTTAALLVGTVASSQTYALDWYISGSASHSNPSSKVFNDGANGAGNPQVEINSDTKIGFAIGLEISPALKVELEYSRAKYGTDTSRSLGTDGRALDQFSTDADLDVDLLTLNASYEFANTSKFTPYLKGGIGSTSYDMKGDLYVGSNGGDTFGGFLPATFTYEGDGSEFAYFVGAGVSMEVSKQLALTLEYRYADLGEIATEYDDNGDRLQTDMKTNNIQAGVTYSFK